MNIYSYIYFYIISNNSDIIIICVYTVYEEAVISMIAPNPYLFIIAYGHITFDLHLFHVCPLLHEYN
jgi:hypothetical protein